MWPQPRVSRPAAVPAPPHRWPHCLEYRSLPGKATPSLCFLAKPCTTCFSSQSPDTSTLQETNRKPRSGGTREPPQGTGRWPHGQGELRPPRCLPQTFSAPRRPLPQRAHPRPHRAKRTPAIDLLGHMATPASLDTYPSTPTIRPPILQLPIHKRPSSHPSLCSL